MEELDLIEKRSILSDIAYLIVKNGRKITNNYYEITDITDFLVGGEVFFKDEKIQLSHLLAKDAGIVTNEVTLTFGQDRKSGVVVVKLDHGTLPNTKMSELRKLRSILYEYGRTQI